MDLVKAESPVESNREGAMNAFQRNVLRCLATIEEKKPLVSGRSFESITQEVLSLSIYLAWCVENRKNLDASAEEEFIASSDELPIRPGIGSFGIWSKHIEALENLVDRQLLVEVSGGSD